MKEGQLRKPIGARSRANDDNEAMIDRIIGYCELSRITGLPPGTLYSMVHHRRIPFIRLGPRTVRFRLSDIEAWIEIGFSPCTKR